MSLEDLLKGANDTQAKLDVSANYHFCNRFLPGLFFYKPEYFMFAIDKPEVSDKLLAAIYDVMIDNGFDIESIKDIKCTVKIDKKNKIKAMIFALSNPEVECECNYVCTVFYDKVPRYFESELYSNNVFGLCERDYRGGHINYGMSISNIQTVEDMWYAITKMQ